MHLQVMVPSPAGELVYRDFYRPDRKHCLSTEWSGESICHIVPPWVANLTAGHGKGDQVKTYPGDVSYSVTVYHLNSKRMTSPSLHLPKTYLGSLPKQLYLEWLKVMSTFDSTRFEGCKMWFEDFYSYLPTYKYDHIKEVCPSLIELSEELADTYFEEEEARTFEEFSSSFRTKLPLVKARLNEIALKRGRVEAARLKKISDQDHLRMIYEIRLSYQEELLERAQFKRPEAESTISTTKINKDIMRAQPQRRVTVLSCCKLKGESLQLMLSLFPSGGGKEMLAEYADMKKFMVAHANGDSEAMLIANAKAAKFFSVSNSVFGLAEIKPIADNAPGQLHDLADKYDVGGPSGLLESKYFVNRLNTPVTTTRISGWLGYFWWELLKDIESETIDGIRTCDFEGCQNPVFPSGKKTTNPLRHCNFKECNDARERCRKNKENRKKRETNHL